MIYRIHYSNGFWGDEYAPDIHSVREKCRDIAKKNSTSIVSIYLVSGHHDK